MLKNPYVRSVLSAVITGIVIAFCIIGVSHVIFSRKMSAPVVVDTSGINEEEPNSTANFLIEPIEVGTPHTPRGIGAYTYFVRDIASSTVLYEKNSERALPIASLTKLVTAVVAENVFDRNAKIKVTPAALSIEGNSCHFRMDESFTVPEMLHPLLMVSSNDAAEAIAQAYKPSRQAFVRAMNTWVYSIGAYHTYFSDPSGLSPKNISSADDISVILEWIYKNRPELVDILRMKSYALRTHVWINEAHFLNLSSYIAGKNSYIPEAKETAVGIFSVKDRLYSVAVLGTKNRDKDVLELLQWITDSGKK